MITTIIKKGLKYLFDSVIQVTLYFLHSYHTNGERPGFVWKSWFGKMNASRDAYEVET